MNQPNNSSSLEINLPQNSAKRNLTSQEYIDWINRIIGTRRTSLEEFSSGFDYCKVLSTLLPGSIDLEKCQRAKSRESAENNLKILQKAFASRGIRVGFEKDDLNIRTLYSKNTPYSQHYKFIRWFHEFYEHHNGPTFPLSIRKSAQVEAKRETKDSGNAILTKPNPRQTAVSLRQKARKVVTTSKPMTTSSPKKSVQHSAASSKQKPVSKENPNCQNQIMKKNPTDPKKTEPKLRPTRPNTNAGKASEDTKIKFQNPAKIPPSSKTDEPKPIRRRQTEPVTASRQLKTKLITSPKAGIQGAEAVMKTAKTDVQKTKSCQPKFNERCLKTKKN